MLLKRYSEFRLMHSQLMHSQLTSEGSLPELPPPGWLEPQDAKFAHRRLEALGEYMATLLAHPEVLSHRALHSFLEMGPLIGAPKMTSITSKKPLQGDILVPSPARPANHALLPPALPAAAGSPARPAPGAILVPSPARNPALLS
mmetsp:Transcript_46644/g.122977  ORF Transcript_46644/g.122977 Transcript_46644/m.122977 type:complete len:145 (+) Transcript_46644:102-536(+)